MKVKTVHNHDVKKVYSKSLYVKNEALQGKFHESEL